MSNKALSQPKSEYTTFDTGQKKMAGGWLTGVLRAGGGLHDVFLLSRNVLCCGKLVVQIPNTTYIKIYYINKDLLILCQAQVTRSQDRVQFSETDNIGMKLYMPHFLQ